MSWKRWRAAERCRADLLAEQTLQRDDADPMLAVVKADIAAKHTWMVRGQPAHLATSSTLAAESAGRKRCRG